MWFQRGFNLVLLAGFAATAFPQEPPPPNGVVAAQVGNEQVVHVHIDLDPQRDMVSAGKSAFLLLPQQFICGPTIKDEVWSPDGRHLAVLRESTELTTEERTDLMLGVAAPTGLDPECEILVWSGVTQKTTMLTRFKKSVGEVYTMQWIAGSSSLVIQQELADSSVGQGGMRSVVALISKNGQRITVRQCEPQEFDEVLPSPNRPIVALIEHRPFDVGEPGSLTQGSASAQGAGQAEKPQRAAPKVQFFRTDGVLSPTITLPSWGASTFWSTNGQLYVSYRGKSVNGTLPPRTWYLVDSSSGKVTEAPVPADIQTAMTGDVTPELMTQNLAPRLAYKKVGVRAPTVIVSKFEAKDDELAVVSTDASFGLMSPTYSAISYRSQGSSMVRPLVKISLDAYQKARVAAIRSKLVDQAKQVALALLMYSNDYDDNYVSNAGNWQNQIEPYIKNMEMLDGINLTFPGGSALSVENPAETVMGFLEGPGGRAVAYADGHVRWIPNQ